MIPTPVKRLLRSFTLVLTLAWGSVPARASALASVTWRIGSQPLRLEAAQGFAGAISSIRFRGREYIDAADHGRELQGAVQFGLGECLNPTLAGASRDPPGRSSSQLLSLQANGDVYRASTRMAFWDRPGERCTLRPGSKGLAANRSDTSDVVYRQQMTPDYQGHPNAILDKIEIDSQRLRPPASVEALTGYMPPAFDTFILYDPVLDRFAEDASLRSHSGERDRPLILSTRDGRAAMGVVGLPAAVAPRYAGFHSDAVSKWSVVYHETAPFSPGPHRYTCVWIIGTRQEVETTLAAIARTRNRMLTTEEALLVGGGVALVVLGGAGLVWWERRRDRSLIPL